MSPFSSAPSSHGSTRTVSPSLTHNLLFNLPGIRHILVFPSKQRTRILEPPNLCSRKPMHWLPRGTLTLEISSCICCCAASASFSTRPIKKLLWKYVYKGYGDKTSFGRDLF